MLLTEMLSMLLTYEMISFEIICVSNVAKLNIFQVVSFFPTRLNIIFPCLKIDGFPLTSESGNRIWPPWATFERYKMTVAIKGLLCCSKELLPK